jgi:hypothetical protein
MTYGDVVRNGWILPKKEMYTMYDVNSTMLRSLFHPVLGRTLTELEAIFVVVCSAVHHDTKWSNRIIRRRNELRNKDHVLHVLHHF